MDFKTVAGWVKIIAYVFALLGLVMAYLDPKTVIAITVGISALVKIVEVLAPITPTTIDDEILKAIKEGAAKDGLIK